MSEVQLFPAFQLTVSTFIKNTFLFLTVLFSNHTIGCCKKVRMTYCYLKRLSNHLREKDERSLCSDKRVTRLLLKIFKRKPLTFKSFVTWLNLMFSVNFLFEMRTTRYALLQNMLEPFFFFTFMANRSTIYDINSKKNTQGFNLF